MISENMRNSVETFIKTTDLSTFYKQYNWKNDNWKEGFKEIFQLEKWVTTAAKSQLITTSHILGIAQWGGLPNFERVRCTKDPLVIPLYNGDEISTQMKNDPVMAVWILKQQTTGIGPTYISKVLRFAAPAEFGALDSRLVRVFGFGDVRYGSLKFLNLTARQAHSGRWYIDSNNWPDEYGTWIEILNYIVEYLNSAGMACPHPKPFVTNELRKKDLWLPADVEMALFSYASQTIYGK